MDNEIIERIIKASFDAWNANRGFEFTIDDMSISEKEFARIHAIQIIKAMREPTDKMMVAAENAYPELLTFADKEESGSYIVWRAMIDAIINEEIQK